MTSARATCRPGPRGAVSPCPTFVPRSAGPARRRHEPHARPDVAASPQNRTPCTPLLQLPTTRPDHSGASLPHATPNPERATPRTQHQHGTHAQRDKTSSRSRTNYPSDTNTHARHKYTPRNTSWRVLT